MLVPVSSLIALFRGDDDCSPCYRPELVAAILDGLADKSGGRYMGSAYVLAETFFYPAELEGVPKVEVRFREEIGADAWDAIQRGLEMWRAPKPAKDKENG